MLGYTNIRNTLKGALDKATIIQTQDKNLEKIAILFNELNDSGQQKALECVELLHKLPEYCKFIPEPAADTPD